MNTFGTSPMTHMGFYTQQLEAIQAFYTAFLGIEPVKVRPGYLK